MEIKTEQKALSEALSWVQNIVERKTTMPILSNVLLEAKGNSLNLTATDLEIGVLGSIKVDVIKGGRITVPARGLYDVVKELPNKVVQIMAQPNHWVEIRCEKSLFKLTGMDPSEFPSLLKKSEGSEFEIEVETLLDMIQKVDFAISTDETRYNLNGIFVETVSKDGKQSIKCVATDGHRLSLSEKTLEKKITLNRGVLLPRKGVLELKRMLEGREGSVHCWIGERHAVFDKDEKMLLVRLIDGQFPPYANVIPQKQKRVLSVSKDMLVHALRRVAVVTTDRSRGVRFSLSPGNLEIHANNPDLGEAKEEIDVQYKGAVFSIGFNAGYFLDCLSILEDEQVVLQLGDEVSPCLIQSELDRSFTHVIMPMRL